MLILGQGALARRDGAAMLAAARRSPSSCGRRCATTGTASTCCTPRRRGSAALDLGFVPGAGGRDVAGILAGAQTGEIDVVYLLGADEIDTSELGNAFVIYQGHHGDAGAHRADVILPGAAYTEKDATYVNTEGRVQRGSAPASRRARRARTGRSCARCPRAGQDAALRPLDRACARALVAANTGSPRPTPSGAGCAGASSASRGRSTDAPFVSPIENFYLTNPICRASVTMARCVERSRAAADGGGVGHGPMAELLHDALAVASAS